MSRPAFLLLFLLLCQPAWASVHVEGMPIAARQVNVLSVHDSSYDKLTNEEKGLLSSYKQVDEKRASRAVASYLKAKHIRVSTATMTMIGSSIEADSARITAQVLNLVSDKNSTFERHFNDSSGLILRTIADKGHVQETAAPSTIAAEKLIFNGRTLGGHVEGGHGEGNHHANDREHHGDNHNALITALSSEHNLNEAQINQIKAVLNSKEWDKEITTLSQTGSLIVQAVVAYVTAGAGSGVTSALMEGMSEVAQAAVAAAIDSVAQQLTSQLLTAALTGNGLHLDVGSIARNAVLSGLVAGVNFKMDAMIKQADLGKVGSAAARGVGHAVTTEAVYGGKFEDALKRSLVSEASAASFEFIGYELQTPGNRKLNLPEATVLHAMVGGALAQISGGDFTTGAIATATAHVVAEQVRSHYLDQAISGEMSIAEMEGKVLAISRLVGGAAAIAVHPNLSPKELSVAQSMSASVAENNSLKLVVTAAKIGKRLYKVSRDLKRAGKKLGKADIKRVLKEEGLDIVGDLYTFIDPNASLADMAWATADLMLGTSFNNRAFAVAKKFGKGKKAKVGHVKEKTTVMPHPFAEGGTHITTTTNLKKYKNKGSTTYGPDTGLYVVPKKQADALLSKSKTRKDIEVGLGLNEGSLSGGQLIRVNIDKPLNKNLRMPDPATGNIHHRPGTGLTTGNINEAVIDAPKIGTKGVRKSVVKGK